MKIKSVLVLILFSFLIFTGTAFGSIANIVSFGDSLSDNGPDDGWGKDRYTDSFGRIWVETLAGMYGVDLYDYAYGGATTGQAALDGSMNGLATQVADTGIGADIATKIPDLSNTLFTVWAGANDIQALNDPYTAAGNVLSSLASLESIGASTFLVPNLPDIAKTPLVYLDPLGQYTDQMKGGMSAWVNAFNTTLLSGLEGFAYKTKAEVYFLDIWSIFEEFTPGDTSWQLMFWSMTMDWDGDGVIDGDGYHPSFAGHTMIAQAAAGVLGGQPLATPLPGAALLMFSGLAGLAAFTRKRAA